MQYNLTELSAPVTEYAILTSLQERFVQGDFYVSINLSFFLGKCLSLFTQDVAGTPFGVGQSLLRIGRRLPDAALVSRAQRLRGRAGARRRFSRQGKQSEPDNHSQVCTRTAIKRYSIPRRCSGESGSGKTYGCHSLVRALLQLLGGARNADTLKVSLSPVLGGVLLFQ